MHLWALGPGFLGSIPESHFKNAVMLFIWGEKNKQLCEQVPAESETYTQKQM